MKLIVSEMRKAEFSDILHIVSIKIMLGKLNIETIISFYVNLRRYKFHDR